MSAVSGCPGKASGGHRKDARGISLFGFGMAALPCCTGRTWKQEVQVLREAYPRRGEHNTVAEGGNRRWAETARQKALQSRWPRPTRGPPAGASAGPRLGCRKNAVLRVREGRMVPELSQGEAAMGCRIGAKGRSDGFCYLSLRGSLDHRDLICLSPMSSAAFSCGGRRPTCSSTAASAIAASL
jgi:hypothetical protein